MQIQLEELHAILLGLLVSAISDFISMWTASPLDVQRTGVALECLAGLVQIPDTQRTQPTEYFADDSSQAEIIRLCYRLYFLDVSSIDLQVAKLLRCMGAACLQGRSPLDL